MQISLSDVKSFANYAEYQQKMKSKCQQCGSRYPIVVQLTCFATLGDGCRSILDDLICSHSNSIMNAHTLLNVYHPAVLRQHFGSKINELSNVWLALEHRYTYSSGTGIFSFGMDQTNFVLRSIHTKSGYHS